MLKLGSKPVWSLAIVLVSACLGIALNWRAPGIERYSHDWLMRLRGTLPVPEDVAIVAIDEASLKRYGRFPWARSLTAQALDRLSAAQPKAIALDILFADPSTESDDKALAQAIAKAGNVVVSAQLIDSAGNAAWLKPLPALEAAAAGVGHVNVSTESDGVARHLLVRHADDAGLALRALPLEAIRVGDNVATQAIRETPGFFILGERRIPVESESATLAVGAAPGSLHEPEVMRAGRIAIDYIGPAATFAPRTYSFADLLDGKIPPQAFRAKYVLVGATAASLGDRLASPFTHLADAEGNQHGASMPGVEVLANSLNTILRSRYYSQTSDFTAFLVAALVATLTLTLLSLAQGRNESVKQIGVLVGMAAAILLVGYAEFRAWLIYPPLVPEFAAFAAAILLGLLHRNLLASAGIDRSIALLTDAKDLAPLAGMPSAAASIARLADAAAVSLIATDSAGTNRVISTFGGQLAPQLSSDRLITVPFANGILRLRHAPGKPPSVDTLEICSGIARSAVQNAPAEPSALSRFGVPRGIEWKARSLDRLNARILERSQFLNAALRSVDDGLLIATADGQITFANRRAEEILAAGTLAGRNLFETLELDEQDSLRRLLAARAPVEREIVRRGPPPRYYTLRVAAVAGSDHSDGPVLGIVASLSDITRQHELRQTQTDVMALVSHEMRTPLTAIQGMSELLAQFEVDAPKRREMNVAINEEAKRLNRMIGDYLDITRLESGAAPLRKTPLQLPNLIERAILMLEPVAALKQIRLVRQFDPQTPVLVADADLVSRAVTNLVSNAIKYSPKGTTVTISTAPTGDGVRIEVADQGYGIPPEDLDRIFEKFYRIPRVQDAGVSGTGLGLALVRDIAQLHGGSVAVKSQPGVGSVFSLIL
jgi:PAS domain S-box-containing protein